MIVAGCAALGSYRTNFLHSGWCEIMFWICAEHSDDAGTGFMQSQAFSAVHAAMLARRLEVLGMLGGDAARTQTDQRDVQCHMISCSGYKMRGGMKKWGVHLES